MSSSSTFVSGDMLREEAPEYFTQKPFVISLRSNRPYEETPIVSSIQKSQEPGADQPAATASTSSTNAGDSPAPMTRTWKYLLDSICKRKDIANTYKFGDCAGTDMNPIFNCTCTVRSFTGNGSAGTKKAAQHLAAKAILDQIIADGRHREFEMPGATPVEAADYVNSLMSITGTVQTQPTTPPVKSIGASCENAVSKLFERSARLKVNGPEFEVIEESGPSHEPVFIMQCRVGDLTTRAQAGTKNKARHESANLLWQRLMALGLTDSDPNQSPHRTPSTSAADSSTPPAAIVEPWQKLIKTVHKSSIDAFGVMEEIIRQRAAGEQQVERGQAEFLVQPDVTTHQDEDNADDAAQCILRFPDAGNLSFIGTGPNIPLAKNAAAYNAIVYMRRIWKVFL